MITINNVYKSFGKLKVLNDVSVSCNTSECIALIGPNGCGKTTLIKSILGMVVPDKGIITFNNKNISKDWEYRKHIGYMPQIGRYPDNMTIGEIIEMIKKIRNTPQHLDYDLLNAFQLEKMFDKKMRTLSGGTRWRAVQPESARHQQQPLGSATRRSADARSRCRLTRL